MQKLRQDAGSPGVNHWGTFYGTQNEFVDFQVHIHDGGSGTPNVTVTTSDFINAKTGTKIAASSKNIVVYREAYINVSPIVSNTQSDTFYKTTGYYPDVLIPAKDPYWGQTTNAWPFNVAPRQNQSAWIDILIPPDAPAGYYLGTVSVKSGVTVLTAMPVIVAVWQWPASQGHQMPSTTSLKTELSNWNYNGLCVQMYSSDYVTPDCTRYPGAAGQNDPANTLIWLDASLLVKDHRFNMGGLQNIYPQSGSFTTWDNYIAPLMDGGCLDHSGKAKICPLLTGSKQTTKSIDWVGTEDASIWNNWQSHFNSKGWGPKLYNYLVDEPQSEAAFKTLVANAARRHGFTRPGIPELVTQDIWWGKHSQSAADAFSMSVCGSATCILNSIDILVSTIYNFEYQSIAPQTAFMYQSWLSGSTNGIPREWWMYQSCTSAGTCANGTPGAASVGLGSGNVWNYPNYDVDGKPAANRAMEWLSALHGNTGELYFAADVCTVPYGHPSCTAPGHSWDPWNGIYFSGGWGDGTLVYAGSVNPSSINYMGAGVTTPIILPSIRLKHIRDGMQDYEYLNLLKNSGQGDFVKQQINSWITNSYTFETTGSGLQTARRNLGDAVHKLSFSTRPPAGRRR